MSVTQEIADRLEEAFAPSELSVVDDSESHRGHGGFREGGESHFNVKIRSAHFKGLSLGPDLIGRIHALALDLDV